MQPLQADNRWEFEDRSAEVEVRHWRGRLRVTCPDDVYFAGGAVKLGGEYRSGCWWFAMADRERVVELCCDVFGGVGDILRYASHKIALAGIAKARIIAEEEAEQTGSRRMRELVEVLDCLLLELMGAEDEP